MRARAFPGIDGYRGGNAYFTCDRCSQTWRRSRMRAEWTGLRVCPPCLDPRPPQMSPPNVYPEGIPFLDARPPQDGPDRLQDDSYLMATMGGLDPTTGQVPLYPSGQTVPGGALSPQDVIPTPVPSVITTQDAITLISGPVPAPESPGTKPNISAT